MKPTEPNSCISNFLLQIRAIVAAYQTHTLPDVLVFNVSLHLHVISFFLPLDLVRICKRILGSDSV